MLLLPCFINTYGHLPAANLERQFGILREQLYCERINQVDTQLSDIRGGRSQEYLGPLQELNENLRTRTEVASVLRRLQSENIQHKFDSEELAALQHFEVYSLQIVRVALFDGQQ